jgi:hypothetical protein
MAEINGENLDGFGGPEEFYLFNRKLGDKLNSIYDEVDKVTKIPESYILLKNFYDLIDSNHGQNAFI